MLPSPTSAELTVAQAYADHHRWLQAWLVRRLGCVHRAADITQDTFVRVLTQRPALGALQEPRAWLTTTARRLVIDDARRRRIESDYLAALAAAGQPLVASAEDTMMGVQSLIAIDQALERVSPKAREAFLRHCFESEPQKDVARSLGVSTRMVHKYLAQVLVQWHLIAS
jgi:RNA polymerase sigma factor (sigma-70 family)